MEDTPPENISEFQLLSNQIQDIVENLPLVNPPKAAAQLYEQMEKIINCSVSINEKVALLAILNSTVDKIYVLLKKQLLQVAPLLAIQKQDTIHLIIQLSIRFATMYASLLNAKNNLPDTIENNKIAKSNAIFNAMHYCLNTLVICYELYMELPSNLWTKLHTLYRVAEKLNLLNVMINNQAGYHNIDQLYKTCLLLATASPYQLRRRDIEALYHIVGKWADKVILDNNTNEAIYLVDLSLDSPPTFKALFPENFDKQHVKNLNTEVFIESIKHIIHQHSDETGIQETALSKNVFDYIVRSWRGVNQRGAERIKKNGKVNVCIGLAATHYFVSGEKYFEQLQAESTLQLQAINNQTTSHDKNTLPFETTQEKTDPWNTVFNTENSTKKENKIQYKLYDFNFVDESSSGFCLITKEKQIPMLQTGEIVGVHIPDAEYQHQWRIGIIRWFKYHIQDGISIGVEILAPNALTVAVRVAQKDTKDIHRALLLPAIANNNRPSTILLPAKEFNSQVGINVFYGQNTSHIILLDPVNINSHFYQFTYQTQATAAKKPISEFNKKHSDEQLDDIWDDLLK
ncbi:MAG: hypothetical protein CMF49_08580 [Legionellales bacterium]|nr:hypothetical protein [Legionellales bacterium]